MDFAFLKPYQHVELFVYTYNFNEKWWFINDTYVVCILFAFIAIEIFFILNIAIAIFNNIFVRTLGMTDIIHALNGKFWIIIESEQGQPISVVLL